MEKEEVIVVDVASIPEGFDVEKWMHIVKTQGLAVIDSNKPGNRKEIVKPYLLGPKRKLNFKIVEIDDYKEGK